MRGLLLGGIFGLLFGGVLGVGAIQMSGDIADSLALHEIVCEGHPYSIEIPRGLDKEEYAGWYCENVLSYR
jgi:hypothetical protein